MWSKEKPISYVLFTMCPVLIKMSELAQYFLYNCYCCCCSPMFVSAQSNSSVELKLLEPRDISILLKAPQWQKVVDKLELIQILKKTPNPKKPCQEIVEANLEETMWNVCVRLSSGVIRLEKWVVHFTGYLRSVSTNMWEMWEINPCICTWTWVCRK